MAGGITFDETMEGWFALGATTPEAGAEQGKRNSTRLAMHARVSGAHLMLSKKFLFKPQRQRDCDGRGDRMLVSNRAGTTGMTEHYLDRLTRARQNHTLAALRTVLIDGNPQPAPGAGLHSGRGAAVPVVAELTA